MKSGHRKHPYTKSFAVSGGSIRAIRRNHVRKMAHAEGMPLRMAWALLIHRNDAYGSVDVEQAKVVIAEREKNRRAKRKLALKTKAEHKRRKSVGKKSR